MTWEEKLRDNLTKLKGDMPLRELSSATGVSVQTLSKILRGDRGIGASVLEQLRRTQPDVLIDVFLPQQSPVCDS